MPLFSREKPKTRVVEQEAELQPLDPIALCLALWLGMLVCVFGFVRMMDDAAQRTANQAQSATAAALVYPVGIGG